MYVEHVSWIDFKCKYEECLWWMYPGDANTGVITLCLK